MTEGRRPTPTEAIVRHSTQTAQGELAGASGIRTRRWTLDLTQDGGLLIRRLKNGATQRLITVSPGSPDTLIPEARITVLDLESGNIINEGQKPRRILRSAIRQIFPDRTAIQDESNRTL